MKVSKQVSSILFIFFFCQTLSVSAQKTNMIGLEGAHLFCTLNNDIELPYEVSSGLSIGAFFRKVLTKEKNVQLRFKTGIYFEDRGSGINSLFVDENGTIIQAGYVYSKFNFLTTPVLLEIYPFDRKKLFVITGFYFSYLVDHYFSEHRYFAHTNFDFGMPEFKPSQPAQFKKYDVGFKLGLGWNINLSDHSNLILTSHFSKGLVNILDDDQFEGYTMSHLFFTFSLGYGYAF